MDLTVYYLSPTASRSVGPRYPDAAGYSAIACNATYRSVTSRLLITAVTVVAVEAAEKGVSDSGLDSLICRSTEMLSRRLRDLLRAEEGKG
jgi:hypothetical protein